jgi:hypothetical protein
VAFVSAAECRASPALAGRAREDHPYRDRC